MESLRWLDVRCCGSLDFPVRASAAIASRDLAAPRSWLSNCDEGGAVRHPAAWPAVSTGPELGRGPPRRGDGRRAQTRTGFERGTNFNFMLPGPHQGLRNLIGTDVERLAGCATVRLCSGTTTAGFECVARSDGPWRPQWRWCGVDGSGGSSRVVSVVGTGPAADTRNVGGRGLGQTAVVCWCGSTTGKSMSTPKALLK